MLPRSLQHLAVSRRLAASAGAHFAFAVAAVPWAVVAFLYGRQALGCCLIVGAVWMGHRAFLRAQAAGWEMDLHLEAEQLERRRAGRTL